MQSEGLAETLDEYRTQQNRLMGEDMLGERPQEDIAAFMRVTERLTQAIPDYAQVFTEIEDV
eukprot:6463342-Amphidinium_carterae.1